MEMDDKAPRAVPDNSGHVPAVTSPMSWERDQSAPLGVFDSRLAEGVTLCSLGLGQQRGQAMHSNRGGTRPGKARCGVSC